MKCMRSVRAACLLLLPFLILNFAPFAYSEERPSIFLEDLTWTELRDEIGTGKTTIIIPIGGTEQNGPAMALGKHNRRVKLLCERIAISLGNALVAPVIAYVPEGNLSPPSAICVFLERSACQQPRLHGFKDIVFLGDHGGYQAKEKNVANKLNREWASSNVRAARGYAILRRDANRFHPNSEGSRVHALGNWNPCGSGRYVADARA